MNTRYFESPGPLVFVTREQAARVQELIDRSHLMNMPAMNPSRSIGRAAREIPGHWLPVHLRHNAERCGWWLTENKHAVPEAPNRTCVRYCSLPIGHVQPCVWQDPTPPMPKES